jgi:hypothetical protein
LERAEELSAWVVKQKPADSLSWYLCGCVLALSGKPGEALKAMESAVQKGWRNHARALRDPDLDSLRGMPAFEEILTKMRSEELRPGSEE